MATTPSAKRTSQDLFYEVFNEMIESEKKYKNSMLAFVDKDRAAATKAVEDDFEEASKKKATGTIKTEITKANQGKQLTDAEYEKLYQEEPYLRKIKTETERLIKNEKPFLDHRTKEAMSALGSLEKYLSHQYRSHDGKMKSVKDYFNDLKRVSNEFITELETIKKDIIANQSLNDIQKTTRILAATSKLYNEKFKEYAKILSDSTIVQSEITEMLKKETNQATRTFVADVVIKPVQRGPRHQLLMKELIDKADKFDTERQSNINFDSINQSLSAVVANLKNINEIKRQRENAQELVKNFSKKEDRYPKIHITNVAEKTLTLEALKGFGTEKAFQDVLGEGCKIEAAKTKDGKALENRFNVVKDGNVILQINLKKPTFGKMNSITIKPFLNANVQSSTVSADNLIKAMAKASETLMFAGNKYNIASKGKGKEIFNKIIFENLNARKDQFTQKTLKTYEVNIDAAAKKRLDNDARKAVSAQKTQAEIIKEQNVKRIKEIEKILEDGNPSETIRGNYAEEAIKIREWYPDIRLSTKLDKLIQEKKKLQKSPQAVAPAISPAANRVPSTSASAPSALVSPIIPTAAAGVRPPIPPKPSSIATAAAVSGSVPPAPTAPTRATVIKPPLPPAKPPSVTPATPKVQSSAAAPAGVTNIRQPRPPNSPPPPGQPSVTANSAAATGVRASIVSSSKAAPPLPPRPSKSSISAAPVAPSAMTIQPPNPPVPPVPPPRPSTTGKKSSASFTPQALMNRMQKKVADEKLNAKIQEKDVTARDNKEEFLKQMRDYESKKSKLESDQKKINPKYTNTKLMADIAEQQQALDILGKKIYENFLQSKKISVFIPKPPDINKPTEIEKTLEKVYENMTVNVSKPNKP